MKFCTAQAVAAWSSRAWVFQESSPASFPILLFGIMVIIIIPGTPSNSSFFPLFRLPSSPLISPFSSRNLASGGASGGWRWTCRRVVDAVHGVMCVAWWYSGMVVGGYGAGRDGGRQRGRGGGGGGVCV